MGVLQTVELMDDKPGGLAHVTTPARHISKATDERTMFQPFHSVVHTLASHGSVQVLALFEQYKTNVSHIESKLKSYTTQGPMFLIDFEGDPQTRATRRSLWTDDFSPFSGKEGMPQVAPPPHSASSSVGLL